MHLHRLVTKGTCEYMRPAATETWAIELRPRRQGDICRLAAGQRKNSHLVAIQVIGTICSCPGACASSGLGLRLRAAVPMRVIAR
jgi:hypothetical protein